MSSELQYPDAKKHLYVSITKSVLRIGAGLVLFFGLFIWAGVLLIAAEVLGIVEELV